MIIKHSNQKTQRLSTNILSCRVDPFSPDELISFILTVCGSRSKAIVSNVNIHAINLAIAHPWFRKFLNHSDVVFCDGFGVTLAARLLNLPRLPRHTPPDWVPQLAKRCVEKDLSFYLLGSKPGVAEQAANQLCRVAPGLKIAGIHHGYFDKSLDSPENLAVLTHINTVQPDILFVGFGMPIQERWLLENWPNIQAHVALPVGAMFDYIAGSTSRAPRWMTDHGLEWLGRLIIEPGRLWRRYLIGNPLFFFRVFLQLTGLKKYPLD